MLVTGYVDALWFEPTKEVQDVMIQGVTRVGEANEPPRVQRLNRD